MDEKVHSYVSIIIPTYNEEGHIRSCLESISELNYPKDLYEIIIVDNGSTDNTVSICKNYTQSIHVSHNLNVGGLRNLGATNALGDILAFIDADCRADKNWLKNAIDVLNIETCVTGADCLIPSEGTWIEKAWASQRLCGRYEPTHLGTANLIVPAEIFRKIGGFDERLRSGEDYEFSMRAKRLTKVISDDAIKVTHYGNPKTIAQFFKREIWHGMGAFGALRINLIDKPLFGTILFIVFTIVQLYSILFLKNNGTLFYVSSTALMILLLITIYHRIKCIKSFKQAAQLLLLYYLFYFGRSLSLLCIVFGVKYKRSR